MPRMRAFASFVSAGLRSGMIVALLSTAAGCATSPSNTALTDIESSALQAHMDYLADDLFRGRMTGTAEYELAARYVESQFRQIGLEPGMGDGYMQRVPLVSGLLDIPGSSLQIRGMKRRNKLRFRDDYIVHADVNAPHQEVDAPLVFVGHGIVAPSLDHDDYADVDVKGKIVVLFPRAPKFFPADERAFYSSGRLKGEEAAKRGAVGVISIRNQYSRDRYGWADQARNAGTQPAMRWVDADGKPFDEVPELLGSASLSDDLAEQVFADSVHSLSELLTLENNGQALPHFDLKPSARIVTSTKITHLEAPNVVARLPGTDPAMADEYVVLLAHLDHLGVGAEVDGDAIYNGAYDNAMGVGLVLETARALKKMGTKRSVLFAAVTAEERGLLGSHYLATHPPAGIEHMVAAITLDMPLLLFPMREVIGFGREHSNLGKFISAAAGAEGMALAEDPMPNEVLFIRSDHYSFVREGVPGLFFFPGFASSDENIDGSKLVFGHLAEHYHKPSDDLMRPVHWPSATRFARINARLAKAIADSAEAPRWVDGNFFAAQFVKGESTSKAPSETSSSTAKAARRGYYAP